MTVECSRTTSTIAGRVPVLDGRRDRTVLPQHLEQRRLRRPFELADAVEMRLGRLDQAPRRPMAAQLEDRPVQILVRREELREILFADRAFLAVQDRFKDRDARRDRGCLDGDRGLERLANELRLSNRAEVDPADEGAGLRVDIDQAFVGQADERLPDRRPTDPETRCHLGLGDGLARENGNPHDRVPQGVIDLGDDRQAAIDGSTDPSVGRCQGRDVRLAGHHPGAGLGRVPVGFSGGIGATHQGGAPVMAWTKPWR